MIQNSIYRGYSMLPGPNDPGIVIRMLADDGNPPIIVGHAPTYYDAQNWIDNYIDSQTPPDPPSKK